MHKHTPGHYLSLIVLCFAFITSGGCSDTKTENSPLTNALEAIYKRSEEFTNKQTEHIVHSLINDSAQDLYSNSPEISLGKARQVRQLTKVLKDKIFAFYQNGKMTPGNADSLYQWLLDWKEGIDQIDTGLKGITGPDGTIFPDSTQLITSRSHSFYETYFQSANSQQTNLLLSSLQLNISIIENKLIGYLSENYTKDIGHIHEFPKPLVTQNYRYIEPEGELIVTAGTGSYRWMHRQTITINGKEFAFGEEAFSVYKLRVSKNPGTYHIPVKIVFFDLDGKPETFETRVEYTVKNCK